MQSDIKYINTVAAELIKNMNWSLVQAERERTIVIMAKKEGELLKLIFMAPGDNSRYYVQQFFPTIREYMKKVGCTTTKLVNISVFEEKISESYSLQQGIADDIEVISVSVNLAEGKVSGTGLEGTLLNVLEKYLELNLLKKYNPVDLESVQEQKTISKPIVTRIILLVNFVLWGLMTLAGGSTDTEILIKFGAMYGPLIVEGEYWRLITPIFLHVGIMHLAFNSYALYQLGSVAETVYGRKRFVLIYFAAGITGSIFSFLLTRSVSAGASGAIFGLLGALLYFGRKKPGFFRKGFTGNLITVILINLFIGFTYPGIDNFAHIGGLIGGYISGYFAGTGNKARFYLRQYVYMVIIGILIVSTLAVGEWVYRGDDLVTYYRARQLVEKGQYSQADRLLESMIERQMEEEDLGIEARYLYAYSRARQGDIKTAIEYAEIVVEKHPDSHNAHLLLGALYMQKGDNEKARIHLEEALRLKPDSEDAGELLEKL